MRFLDTMAFHARRALGVAVLSALATAAQAGEPPWPAGPYRYIVIDQDVRDVLVEFGRNIGVPVKTSAEVKGRLRGPGSTQVSTREESAKQFLQRICDAYGLVWYFDGTVLYVNAEAELRTEMIGVGRLRAAGLRDELASLGVADERYPIRATNEAGVVSVSGPPPYVALVKKTVATMVRAAEPRSVREVTDGDEVKVRVFRGNTDSSS
jgi:type II secretory pathway component GspD/PulD (secretin)